MRRIVSGGKEIDACTACGALWFDPGEIRELTEGRLPAPGGEGSGPVEDAEGKGKGKEKEKEKEKEKGTGKIKTAVRLSLLRAAAASAHCPRCEGILGAVDFQATGIPVLLCPSCGGILAPREFAAEISERFRFVREHGVLYEELGRSLATTTRRRMETKYGFSRRPAPGKGEMTFPLPVVVPLADDGPELGSLPLVTYGLIAVSVVLYILRMIKGGMLPLPGGLPGLPAGAGFAEVPRESLLVAPLLHAGIVPLVIGSFFLLVLGDNVEDRIGRVPFLLFFLFCGAVAGAAHVLWGKAGGPPATGSAGAAAGILGAYLVFFPNVSLRVYGMGRIVSLPAYLFACAWVVAVFFLAMGMGPIEKILFPGSLSLAGNMAGFGAGIAGASLWRFCEDAVAGK